MELNHHSTLEWVHDSRHATCKHKRPSKGVNVVYIHWACIQDSIRGHKDHGICNIY